MPRSVRYDSRKETWYFGDARRTYDGAYSIVIKRHDLTAGTATDLAHALREAREHDAEPESVLIDLAPDHEYSPKESVVDPISYVLLDDGRLGIQLHAITDEYYEDDAHIRNSLIPVIQPLLSRRKIDLVSMNADGHRSTAPYWNQVILTMPTRGKTLQQLYDAANDVANLLDAATTGNITRETAVDLIMGNKADLLIGLPEGPWLDVKSQHYDLSLIGGQISLAQAVGRFGNGEEGGIVVVGMETKKIPGSEIIRRLKPVPIDTATVRRYRQALENRLYPFPYGLKVATVETHPGQGLVVTSIPPQEEELKPFLVHGAIVNNRTEGTFISIVRRSGEDSIPITAPQIHSTLSAGRALLRRGHLPKNLGN